MRKVITILFMLLFASQSFAEAAPMSVTVREAQVRSAPSFVGKIVGVFAYADAVELREERAGWGFVSAGTVEGWVHMSALTDKRIILTAGDENVGSGASSGEVALAGKGFNKQVEDKYKEEQKLDYAMVDEMETIVYAPEELVLFMTEGGLNMTEAMQ